MAFSIFLLVFLLASAYFLSIQGMTSAIIMSVLTVLCVALSIGTYEYVAESFLMQVKPDIAYAVALIGMFVIPLGLLRLLMDKIVPRSSLFPEIIDRVGSIAGGAISAFFITGMLALAIQMIPWPGGFMGFSRFDPENPDTPKNLWFSPDRATAGFGSALCSGVFSGERDFVQDHPDLVDELSWAAVAEAGVRLVVPADAVQVTEANRIDYVYSREEDSKNQSNPATYGDPVDPKPNSTFTRVQLQIGADGADTDNKHRFKLTCVSLIGVENGDPKAYHAIAMVDPDEPHRYINSLTHKGKKHEGVDFCNLIFEAPGGKIDVAIEHPKSFTPQQVVYKLGGRALMPGINDKAPTAEPIADVRPTPTPVPQSSGGNANGVHVKFGSSHFGSGLPLAMTSFSGSDTDIKGGGLVQGHLYGYLEDQGVRGSERVSKLTVPKGKGLLHLNVENLRANSTLGRALNFAVQTVQNYTIKDDRGKIYTPVGKYAVAKVGDRQYVEIIYFPEYAESGGRIPTFNKIKSQHLKGDYQYAFLYLVDSGAKVVEFSTGRKTANLSRDNLVAR